ncbi:hypothetical protein F383_25607 [Gossypium arboreum]|uniref:Uncharacterized protein n=1 Tax=Gossypium arboreum TaxID=29729 RepID=A0A0B0NWX7_GOSAR|nr:hypothetical protein F383_25607 [Gossypium arboreum]
MPTSQMWSYTKHISDPMS